MRPGVIRKWFGDFVEYSESLPQWNAQAVQLSRGMLSLSFDSFSAGNFFLSRLQFDQDAIVTAVRDPGWHAIAIHAFPKRWCGIDLRAGAIVAAQPGRETTTISRSPWDSMAVVVRSDVLATWPSPLANLADQGGASERSFFQTDAAFVKRFWAWVEQLFRMPPVTGSEPDITTWVDAIGERLQSHLLNALGHRPAPDRMNTVQRVARYDLLLAALRLIHRDSDHRPTVGGIARELGVGARSVEYAFSHVVGVSPATYILAERLNRSRHDLMSLGTEKTVTSVAYDYHFENLSRFAMQYARLFDERPSDTLRRARENFRQAK